MSQSTLSSIHSVCKEKLLSTKAELLNRMQAHRADFYERHSGGDEADQSVANTTENQLFHAIHRVRQQIVEIEAALARIENGTYGICEETQEPIETNRLLAIPWTRLSLEGAEIRENFRKNSKHA